MKKYIYLFFIGLLSITLVNCDVETSSVDPTDIGGTEQLVIPTITPDVAGGEIAEGSTITFDIEFDKSVRQTVTWIPVVVGGSASEDDVDLSDTGVVNPYRTSASLSVPVLDDGIPEENQTITIQLQPISVESGYWISPEFDNPTFTYTIVSPVDPDDLIVAMEWDFDASHDMDMFAFSEVNGPWDSAATGDIPESKNMVWGVDPDGTYFLGVDPFDIQDGATVIDTKFSFGQPNGQIDVFEHAFDVVNRDAVYMTDDYNGTTVYLLFRIEKVGTEFTITEL